MGCRLAAVRHRIASTLGNRGAHGVLRTTRISTVLRTTGSATLLLITIDLDLEF
jgi:hypothetical protein